MLDPVTGKIGQEVGKKVLKETAKLVTSEVAKASDDENLSAATKHFNKTLNTISSSKGGAGFDQSDSLVNKSNFRTSQSGKAEMFESSSAAWNKEIIFPGEIQYKACTLGIIGRNDGIKIHPKTNVEFQEKEIKSPETGEKEIHSFPKFEPIFEAQLPENLYKSTDADQFNECNKQLKDWCEKNPDKSFTESQLKQIEAGDNPKGYTWHHNEDAGKMQLVDSDIHQQTGHTGGRAIWGGGTENR